MKTSSEFSDIYQNGKKWHIDSAVIFYKASDKKRVGFIASKKVGNSVKRNLAKRRLRAIFREHSLELKSGDYVFIAKNAIHNIDYLGLKNSILWSFKRLECFLK
ncbi:MAG: ribonuclease P protein component [Campylobacteraceae bacterium]